LHRRAASVGTWRRLPLDFAAVIDACLEPDPGGRPTVAQLTNVLEPFADGA
jgi:hypothetical protein